MKRKQEDQVLALNETSKQNKVKRCKETENATKFYQNTVCFGERLLKVRVVGIKEVSLRAFNMIKTLPPSTSLSSTC